MSSVVLVACAASPTQVQPTGHRIPTQPCAVILKSTAISSAEQVRRLMNAYSMDKAADIIRWLRFRQPV